MAEKEIEARKNLRIKEEELKVTKTDLIETRKKYNDDLSDYKELKQKFTNLESKFTQSLTQSSLSLSKMKEYESEVKQLRNSRNMYTKTIESLKKELQKELKKSLELSEKLKEIEIKNASLSNIDKTVAAYNNSPTGRRHSGGPHYAHGSSSNAANTNLSHGHSTLNASPSQDSSNHPSAASSFPRSKSTLSVGEDSCYLGHDPDTREANWQYLKHIVLKFILANSVERDLLAKVLATVLHLNIKEEELLYETLEYKKGYPFTRTEKPKVDI